MPLHQAAQKGHATVVDQLISAGATVDAVDKDGRGPGRVFGCFWGGSDEVTKCFFVHLAGEFRSLLWDVEWCWHVLAVKRSFSFELGWVSWNSGIRHHQTWRT